MSTVTFEPISHTYQDENGNFLTSVSKVIETFKNKFDSDYWSKKKAKKRGVDQSVILTEWKAKSDNSIVKGNGIHEAMEQYFINGTESELIISYLPIVKVWKEQNYEFMPEKLLYSTKYMVAGTADMIIKTGGNSYSIIDWKTNAKIKMNNGFQKMLGCCHQLDDCNFNQYSLQQNLYGILLQEMYPEATIQKMSIIHLNDKLNIIPIDINPKLAIKVLENYVQISRTKK
jgi:ATP-dependent exoDNAse (exonuclease V) beta subunit